MKAGWEWRPLGEVCKTGSGATPLKTHRDYYEGGTIPWLLSGEVAQGEISEARNFITEAGLKNSAAKVFPVNSVLIAMYGATAGQVGILRFEAATNQAVCAILPNPRFLPEFLFYVFLHLKESLIATATGNAQPNISQIKIKSTVIPIPPVDEQRRIVAVLDKAFAGIATATANAQKNLTNARELSAAIPAGSSTVIRMTIGEFLERRWLLDHMDGNHGGDYPRKDEFVADGVTYLSANSIRNGEVDFSRAKYLAPARAAKLRKGFARDRDVLFAHNATVGPVALLETDADYVILGTSLTYYRCDESRIKPEYLASYLASSAFKSQYEVVMRQSTRNQVPITKQREFYIDLPTVEEQSRMVASLVGFQESGRRLVKQYQAKLTALTELKQSLLQKAFAGELT